MKSKVRSIKSYYVNKKCPTRCYDEGGENCVTRIVHGCRKMGAMWPVVMADMGGYRVCAKRGGLPFKDAIRVEDSGKCSDVDFIRCNQGSTKENAICVRKGEKCPVTRIQFVNSLTELHDLVAPANSTFKMGDVVGY